MVRSAARLDAADNDRAAMRTPSRGRQNRLGTFGAGHAAARQEGDVSFGDELFGAAVQSAATDQIPHVERIHTHGATSHDNAKPSEKRIHDVLG
jgi:hypothetical protein